MRNRWIVPISMALLSLVSVILLSQVASQALVPTADLEVFKSVSPTVMASGRPVTYDAVLDNTSGEELEALSLVDTLPPGWVRTSPDRRAGTMVADVGGTLQGGEAARLVAVDDVSLEKTAASTHVLPGGVATYTVTFHNGGYVARDLDMVGDELPPDVSFNRMTDDSDVTVGFSPGTTGTLVWLPPLSVPPQGELVLEYEVTMPLISDTVSLVNKAWGQLDGTMVGPDGEEVTVGRTSRAYFPTVMYNYAPPVFSVSKTAYPQVVFNNAGVAVFTYTVHLYNDGTVPGVLADVEDTLPNGFVFESMVTHESDVDSGPSGTTGEIVWTGPFTVAGKSSLSLVYRVTSAPTLGTYVNSATATTVDGKGRPPQTPGQATVYILEPIYLAESWENPSPYWQPYLDYWRLNPLQWYLQGGAGVGGSTALKHTASRGVDDEGDGAHDAVYMFLGPDSEGWTNYRYEAKVKMNKGTSQGLWFRGAYEESTTGRDPIQGYYLVWRTGENWIKLSRIQDSGKWAYDFRVPVELEAVAHTFIKGQWYNIAVEVTGPRIKAFVNGVEVINHLDDTWSTGTVGMFCYQVQDAVWDNILVTALP